MNGWNRLFVVAAVVWALVAPFLLIAENNKPAERLFSLCSDAAYHLYGSSSSSQLDMDRYRAEEAKCSATLVRGLVGLPEMLGAMIGAGDWKLGAVAWGFILIPLALLWIVARSVARVVLGSPQDSDDDHTPHSANNAYVDSLLNRHRFNGTGPSDSEPFQQLGCCQVRRTDFTFVRFWKHRRGL